MLFVIALTSLFVLLAISMNNRCWHNTSCVHTFCGLCTNTGIHRSSTGMVFALVTQNIQTPWTISLSFRFQNAFVCDLAAVYNRGKLLKFMIKERRVRISVKRNIHSKVLYFAGIYRPKIIYFLNNVGSRIVRALRYLFYFKLAWRRLHEQPKHVATH